MSVRKTFNITLDVSTPLTTEEFRVKQGDTGNTFVITLQDDGVAVNLTNCRVVALFTKGDRLAMQDNWTDDGGVTISGDSSNIVTIDLFNGSFVPGLNECELQIYSGEELDVLITSARFNFRCARSLINEETIRSMQGYTLLASLITTVQNIVYGVQSDWNQLSDLNADYIKNKPTSFPPSAHAVSHASDGMDAITPSSIGAVSKTEFNTHASAHAATGDDPITPASIGAAVASAATVTLTVAGWTGSEGPYEQTVAASGVLADVNACHVVVGPALASQEEYGLCTVAPSAQGAGTLTFTCAQKPESALSVQALVVVNGAAQSGVTVDADDQEVSNLEILNLWNS